LRSSGGRPPSVSSLSPSGCSCGTRTCAKRRASVGAILGVTAWFVESLVFAWYISTIANFNTAVGSLTVLIVVCMYFYVGSIILLVGIELDEPRAVL
jgi:uncharacterized BrkB/YihY/UPF0761 family membrane protein